MRTPGTALGSWSSLGQSSVGLISNLNVVPIFVYLVGCFLVVVFSGFLGLFVLKAKMIDA